MGRLADTKIIQKKMEGKINKNELIDKLVNEIASNKAEIMDSFFKTFLVAKTNNRSDKEMRELIKRVELVEQVKSPTEFTYFFRIKDNTK